MKNSAFLFKYSYRNLFRHKRRTFILAASLTLACTLVIWIFNLNQSARDASTERVTAQYVGRLQVMHPELDILGEKFKMHKFLAPDSVYTGDPLFESFTPRVLSPVFISGDFKTGGVLLVGIDPMKEKVVTDFHLAIAQGDYFHDPKVKNPILLGLKLAKRLDVKLGNEVVILGQGVDGSIANDLFTIVGLFNWGGGSAEEKIAFTTLYHERELLGLPEGSFHVLVGKDESLISEIEAKGLKAVPWQKILPDVFVSFDFLGKINFVLIMLTVMVICLGITNTLLVTFKERENELKSLNTIGATSKWVGLSLAIEVYTLLLFALIVGSLSAFCLTLYFQYQPIDLRIFSGNEKMMVGGMSINSYIFLKNIPESYFKGIGLLVFFVTGALLIPMRKALKNSKKAA